MRYLYTSLLYLALPVILARLLWCSLKLPGYRKRWGERLGYFSFQCKKSIWIHAVSVGEVAAATPLIHLLLARYPHLPIVVTTMTPTGAERVTQTWGEQVRQVYVPYDLPGATHRFLHRLQPAIAILIETELWPNLLAACQYQHVPVCLINARLSEKSASGYRRIAALTRDMLQSLRVIAAHSQADAARFIALGAATNQVIVTGNLKFDLVIPPDLFTKSATLRKQIGGNRFIWVAASTHDGEEAKVIAAHQHLRNHDPSALLILVPRHPDRFDAVAKLVQQSFVMQRRSENRPCDLQTAVYLGDTMGELLLWYGMCDAAFVGGSLVLHGGHNWLEPAALGKPILTGKHLDNFADISTLFLQSNAMIQVDHAEQLALQLIKWQDNAVMRAQIGQRAQQIVDANRGALARQFEMISEVLLGSKGS